MRCGGCKKSFKCLAKHLSGPKSTVVCKLRGGAMISSRDWATDKTIDKRILKGLGDNGIEKMSIVQEQMVDNLGSDIIAIAKTGHGKTLAFLVSLLQLIVSGNRHGCIIIANTNDLVHQIAEEAKKYAPLVGVEVVEISRYSNKSTHTSFVTSQAPQLLVCTERIVDLYNTNKEVSAYISQHTDIMVIDEADRMLTEIPSRKNMEFMASVLPKDKTFLLTSATFSDEAKKIAQQSLSKKFVIINASNANSNAKADKEEGTVDVRYQEVEPQLVFPAIASAIIYHIVALKKKARILVFFNTAMLAESFAILMNELLEANKATHAILHGKMDPKKRQKSGAFFTSCENCAMMTTLVSARGMDYQNVSLVIQIGYSEADNWIQSRGRTGRWKSKGLMLSIWMKQEKAAMLKALASENITEIAKADEKAFGFSGEIDSKITEYMKKRGADEFIQKKFTIAYKTFLGYYSGGCLKALGMTKKDLVQACNEVFSAVDLKKVIVDPKIAKKMGLANVLPSS
jgi:ATP-dependent RNA helicase MSS116